MLNRTIALCFEYRGTAFVGSQWQREGRSVQAELEAAWTRFTGETRRWTFAGRTDAGVHALAQVAHIQSETTRSLDTIVGALNALTSKDISIHEAWEMPGTFHARFSARQRAYRYLLDVHPTPSAVLSEHAVYVTRSLNTTAMQGALNSLIGTHNFAAFAGSGHEGSTVRECTAAQLESIKLGERSILVVHLSANAFLKHMVRNIVGTVLLVGTERISLDEWTAIFASHDRRKAGPTAPAHGLYLETICYDPTFAPLAASTRWDGTTYWRTYTKV
jgi:tRNA pseudouridine38-40 synthase